MAHPLPCVRLMRPAVRHVDFSGRLLPLVINPDAGSAAHASEEIVQALEHAGVRVSLQPIEPAQLIETVRRLSAEGSTAIAIGGGDGTISSAVDVLAGTNTVLVPLPLGTLNHFAQRYGLATLDA